MNRSNSTLKCLRGLIFANLFLLCQSLWSASQAESNAELIEAAKSEGNVSYYTP